MECVYVGYEYTQMCQHMLMTHVDGEIFRALVTKWKFRMSFRTVQGNNSIKYKIVFIRVYMPSENSNSVQQLHVQYYKLLTHTYNSVHGFALAPTISSTTLPYVVNTPRTLYCIT